MPVASRRLEGADLDAEIAADVVLDCSDNFATRHAINRACVAHRKPLVSGAAVRFDGQVSVFDLRKDESPCYHRLFPEGRRCGGGALCGHGGLRRSPASSGRSRRPRRSNCWQVAAKWSGRLLLLDALGWNGGRSASGAIRPVRFAGHAERGFRRPVRAFQNRHQPQLLLGPEVVAGGDLFQRWLVDAGRRQTFREVQRAEKDVPDRQQDRKVAAFRKRGIGRQVDGVVPAVVARADDQVIADRAEIQPGWWRGSPPAAGRSAGPMKCPGGTPISSDRQANHTPAITSSSRWLRESVQNDICRCEWWMPCSAHHQPKVWGQAMAPVLGKVEDHQIDHEALPAAWCRGRAASLRAGADDVVKAQPALQLHENRGEQHEDRQRDHAHPVEHRIDDVHPARRSAHFSAGHQASSGRIRA